jgi:hypothetical protein
MINLSPSGRKFVLLRRREKLEIVRERGKPGYGGRAVKFLRSLRRLERNEGRGQANFQESQINKLFMISRNLKFIWANLF